MTVYRGTAILTGGIMLGDIDTTSAAEAVRIFGETADAPTLCRQCADGVDALDVDRVVVREVSTAELRDERIQARLRAQLGREIKPSEPIAIESVKPSARWDPVAAAERLVTRGGLRRRGPEFSCDS